MPSAKAFDFFLEATFVEVGRRFWGPLLAADAAVVLP